MKKITLIIIILLWVLRIDVKSQSASDYIGVIPGTIDVSPSGAATYTIPIEVVPGTLGIQPVLAISYNSQGGMSILGEKWHLSGLSAINRVPQDIYHENNKTSVQLDYQDRFTLDGNRLLKSTENAYGANGTEYVPEFENFSSVKSFGILGNGPLYFEVTNADGCIIQYGNSSDSRQVVGGTVFNWLINKITDPFGNYMTFSYGNSNREIWIEQIDYTGNRSLTPYARIKFEYLSDGSHYRSGFVVGYEIKQTRLLEKIRIQYDENGFSDIRRYEFSYLNTYPPRLNTITQYGTEGERLLPTTIIWEDTHAGSFAEMEYDLNISGGITAYPADLNGDKYSDFIALIGSSWVPFLNSDGTFIRCPAYSSGLSTHYSLNNCVIGDWDGDGKDEVISVHYSAAQALYTLNLSKLRPDLSAITTNTLFSYRPEVSGGSLIVKSGYFSGNGKAELLLWENEKITIKGQNVEASYPIPRNYPLTLLDYNGNGKTDILLMSMDSSRYIVCEYNSSSNLIEIIADVSNHNLGTATPFVGDFNGDGISDLLWRVQGSSFKIALGTGNGFSTPISKGFTHNSNSYPVICDINGDGKDDFIGLQSESPYTIHYYLSQGYHSNGLHFSQGKIYQIDGRHPDNYFLTMGDFNGEHTIDYLSISKTGGASKLHSIKNNLQEHLVKQVKNGFNFTIDIKYKPFYSLGIDHASFKKQIVSFFLPEYIEMPSGFGSNKKRINYEFSDPIVSYKRNAFLGFTSFNAYDNVSTEQTQLSFFKNNIRDILLHRSKSLQKANIPIEDSYYVYSIRDLGFGNFLPYISSDTTIDRLSQRVTETTRQVDAKGRINRVETKILPLNSSQFLIKEVTLYTYTDVALVNAATVSKLRSVSKNSYLQNSQYSQNKYTLYQYTTNGKPASCQETDTEGTITTTYGNYDSFGNAKRITVSSPGLPSRIENKTFDPTGRFMISYKNPLSQTTSYSHDPRTGNLLSSTDINGLTTTFQYDEFGRETLCRHPDGTQTETSFFWTFDSDYHPGYYAKRTGYTASSSDIVYYDQYNRAICQKTGNNGYVDTRYDNKGRVYQVSFPYKTITDQDGSKQWTQYYYNSDPLGRLSREISPQRSLEYTYGTNSVTVTDTRANVSSTKTYDVAGRLSSAIDYGGTITYSYSYVSQQGKIRNLETISLHGNTTTIITDCRGNRLSIDEPNAGLITSSYNGYGQLVSQTDANGNTTSFLYDVLGRVTRETMSPLNGTPVVTSYEYDHYEASKRGRGQISRIVTGGATKNLFRCDALGRLAEEATYIDGTEYKQLYTYNSAGQLYEITYPDGFAIVHNYDIYGDLYEIRRKDNNALIYKKHEKNQFNKVTRFSYGNNVATERTYNDFGQLTRIKTGNKKNSGPIVRPPGTGGIGVLSTTLIPVPENFTIDSTYQNLDYTYNTRGLMTQRANLRNNQNETFTYDKLDRLTSYRINNYLNRNFAYDNSGNLTFNSGLGNLNYEGEKPHAVTSVDMFGNSTIPTHDCIVTYNQFHKPTTITEGTNELLISYGVDKQREKS
ncbi:FG-GAP-like repeat-containing protein, partial [Bacteroidales bacterium OttesenSCG-928-E04]|nr:FG-GAP-like repeat-containing protein [Bacteroidales bacterium OttesenSCG-928-E04]